LGILKAITTVIIKTEPEVTGKFQRTQFIPRKFRETLKNSGIAGALVVFSEIKQYIYVK